MSKLHSFDTSQALAEALADRVTETLRDAIKKRGAATLAVSGGSTPGRFFDTLSTRDIAWEHVVVTLVDERFVPQDNPRSNHALVAERLLKNNAAAARFMPLYQRTDTAEAAAEMASAAANGLSRPFDAVILGMGSDGHTASFFPGGNHLAEALDPAQKRPMLTMEAEGAGEPRLTFSFARLQDARFLAVHIEGESKKAVLEKAAAGTDEAEMPIRSILKRASTEPDIYWAP